MTRLNDFLAWMSQVDPEPSGFQIEWAVASQPQEGPGLAWEDCHPSPRVGTEPQVDLELPDELTAEMDD